MSRLDDIAAERRGPVASEDRCDEPGFRFVTWYRGPRGVGVRCTLLGFNAGVVVPLASPVIGALIILVTALSIAVSLSRLRAP